MGLKAYIGFSLLFLIAVGMAVFANTAGDYQLEVFGIILNLPVVFWVLLPACILFIFSVLHLMFYGTIHYYKNRAYQKDEATLVEMLKSLLLDKTDKKKCKTDGFKNLSSILSQLEVNVKDNTFTSKNESLNELISQIKDIKAGKFINEKALKLDKNSPLAKQNLFNKINEQADYSLDIIKKSEQFPQEVVRLAFFNVLENKAMTTVKKVYSNVKLDKEMALKLFLKDIDNKEFGLTKEEIIKITNSLEYTSQEYLVLAKLYKDALSPDKYLELFEAIFESKNDIATDAYFFVLCELEMIDKVRDLLTGYNENELLPFRALLDLKAAGKHYTLEDLNI